MRKTVKVTLRDIAKGIAMSPYNCPVALAIRRDITDDRYPIVTAKGIGFPLSMGPSSDDRVWVKPSKRLATFIRRFDAGLPVDPIIFRIDVPEEETE